MNEGIQGTAPVGLMAMRFLEQTALDIAVGDLLALPAAGLAASVPVTLGWTDAKLPVEVQRHFRGTPSFAETVTTIYRWLPSDSMLLALSRPSEGTGTTTTVVLPPDAVVGAITLQRFQRTLDDWKGLLASRHYDAMRAHIERLLADEEELETEGIKPSIWSIRDLLAFLADRPWSKAPAVGLDSKGRFSISWAAAHPAKADLTLTFLGNGSVRWYVYDACDMDRPALSGTGVDRMTRISRIVASYGCNVWAAA